MYNYPVSVILSFIGLALVVAAYFVRKKELYFMHAGEVMGRKPKGRGCMYGYG